MKIQQPRIQSIQLHYHANIRNPATNLPRKTRINLSPRTNSTSFGNGESRNQSPRPEMFRAQPLSKEQSRMVKSGNPSEDKSRMVMIGAATLGIAFLLMGFDDNRAMAFGPEGPRTEDFWDNMRRYGLYALTVSTGAIYALLERLVDLLKNPISAILVIVLLGGGFFLVSQVVTAMVGMSDFSYDYGY